MVLWLLQPTYVQVKLEVPLIVRLEGTNVELGKTILKVLVHL
jgi:succinyl-CoA synthetase beta subunit